jgi:tetratricopeptide (TPR) repeat protein
MTKTAYSFRFISVALAAALFFPGSADAQRGGSTGRMQIPVQKSGKVQMEDGTPPPESVIVEASCGSGVAVPIARTDSRGGFIVGRGRDSDVDARLQRGSTGSSANLAGCALFARLPGYQSSAIRVVDNEAIDLGTIVLSRFAVVEGTMHSATSLRAPKDARKAFEKATQAVEKKKWNDAQPQFEKAVAIYPEYAAAWFELGRVYQGSGDLAKARNAYEQSIKADPKFVKPYFQLAGVLYQEKNWQAAADMSATVIKLDPHSFVAAYVLNAVSHFRLGNAQPAEASARQAIKLDTEHAYPEAEYTLGVILGARGQYAEAVEHLRSYLRIFPNSPAAEAVKKQVAEFEQAMGPQAPGATTPPR